MEAVFVNLVEPGDKVICFGSKVYSGARMQQKRASVVVDKHYGQVNGHSNRYNKLEQT